MEDTSITSLPNQHADVTEDLEATDVMDETMETVTPVIRDINWTM